MQTATEREARQRAASRQGLYRLSQISTLLLVAVVLAMVAAMGSMIWQARGRLVSLKLDGFSDLEVWRTLLLLTLILVGAASLIGAVFGLYGQLLASHATLTVTGFPVVSSIALGAAAASMLLVTALATATTAVPGLFVARIRPTATVAD